MLYSSDEQDKNRTIASLREEIETNERTIEELMDTLAQYELDGAAKPKPAEASAQEPHLAEFMQEYETMIDQYHSLLVKNKELESKNEHLKYQIEYLAHQQEQKENRPSRNAEPPSDSQRASKSPSKMAFVIEQKFEQSDALELITSLCEPWL